MDTSHINDGEIVDGYTVLKTLGHGGMSDVYLARDDAHARQVTLKFPHDDMMGDVASYERFLREVKIGQLLDHPNIQKLYRVAHLGRLPYLVLEYVPGETLRHVLREEFGGDPVERAVRLGLQIGRALAYAHEKGVFHRDMKPENVIVSPDGVAKVMDFGIAFVEGAKRITWGSMSSQVGTPDYMAPEQIKGQRGDARTDVYALGMMIYEMAANRLPYEGDNSLAVMSQHVTMPPPLLSQFCAVSPALEEAIMKAIRRDAAHRWPTMQAFVSALEAPAQVDVAALRATREREEGETKAGENAAPNAEVGGVVWWQVVLIVLGVLVALLLVGVLAQLGHRG